ncbi:hypothetical protein [Variovorax sp. Sphag1AA]|uniref:hypothetical protein n=1 Tax=Variovorax sp. Sphag1AA TaxID=2587027 RepID=UPI0016229B80|nr:hypothetical protein [Variovorax sp. Sphag1AA]MBB3178563.1 hypothetical protein [Variovorax sp. Sphag1AA]
MKLSLLSVLAALTLCACSTTQSDLVLLKNHIEGPRCTAPAAGACASCETGCPVGKQALCIGGTNAAETASAAPSCVKPASCSCM